MLGSAGGVPRMGRRGNAEVGKELQDLLRQILQGGVPPGAQASRAVSEGGAGEPGARPQSGTIVMFF